MENPVVFKDADIMGGDYVVVHGLNMEIAKGDLVYIIGKVGSGKTSIIRTLTGEIPLKKGHGEVCGFKLEGLRGRDIPRLRRKLGDADNRIKTVRGIGAQWIERGQTV